MVFFWDGLFGCSFSLPLFCWPFVVFLVYVLYTLFFFFVNIVLFIDKKMYIYIFSLKRVFVSVKGMIFILNPNTILQA